MADSDTGSLASETSLLLHATSHDASGVAQTCALGLSCLASSLTYIRIFACPFLPAPNLFPSASANTIPRGSLSLYSQLTQLPTLDALGWLERLPED